jgi:hypothetical protein
VSIPTPKWEDVHSHEAPPAHPRAGGPKGREGERLLNEGKDITEVPRHLEIAESTWNRWRNRYGGMKASEARRLREQEIENGRLKRLLTDAELAKAIPKEVAEGDFQPRSVAAGRSSPCKDTSGCRAVGPLESYGPTPARRRNVRQNQGVGGRPMRPRGRCSIRVCAGPIQQSSPRSEVHSKGRPQPRSPNTSMFQSARPARSAVDYRRLNPRHWRKLAAFGNVDLPEGWPCDG